VSPVQLAAVLAAIVLVASTVSVELGVTVALLELTLGVAAGNLFHLQTQDWLDSSDRSPSPHSLRTSFWIGAPARP
jgi:hypothetical protein